MRIISKFRDYYDSVQGVMYDSDIIYIRKSVKHQLDFKLPYYSFETFSTLEFIGFCGNIYPVIISKNVSYENRRKIPKNVKFFKRRHDVLCDTIISYDMNDAISRVRTGKYLSNNSKILNSINNFSRELKSLDLFEKYQTPIFGIYLKENILTLDTSPELKDFNFQSIIDPFTAYQEIVMWLGNKAVNEYPPQITDNIVLRDSKGFDNKSFKRRPTKKLKGK